MRMRTYTRTHDTLLFRDQIQLKGSNMPQCWVCPYQITLPGANNGQTSKRPASDGGQCSGQLLMMWSAVCSGSPHSHAALSASPHFFMEALYRPTPVRSLFRVVQCFRLSSSPLTPSSGSDTWRCTRYVMYRLYYIYILYIIYTVTVCMCLDL